MKEFLQETDDILNIEFFGRTEELKKLEQLICEQSYRLITLVGMTGIGKTCLAGKFAEKVRDNFQYVIWKNFRTAYSFEDTLSDLLNFLSVNSDKLPSSSTDRVQCLIEHLQINKCLLILDDLTEILDEDDCGKVYKEGWQQLGRFLEKAALLHQSNIIITCHEPPQHLKDQKIQKKCYNFPVEGLKYQDLKMNFYDLYTQTGAIDDWKSFVNHYGGNPGFIEIAAKWVSAQYDGNISMFLECECKYGSHNSILEDIYKILNEQFRVLRPDEKDIMYLLAIRNEPVSLTDIKHALCHNSVDIGRLKYLSLIKETSFGYTQVPTVMDYVTERIINKVVK